MHLAIAGPLFHITDTFSEQYDLPDFRTSARFNTRDVTDDDKVMGKEDE